MTNPNEKLPPFRPSGLFDDFGAEMDAMIQRFFGDDTSAAAATGFPSLMTAGAVRPAIDITENDKAITLTAELPGMSEEEVDLSISDGMLMLKGEKTVSHDSKQDDSVVPDRVDQEAIDAKFDKGILKVTLPKKPGQEARGRRIRIGS